MTITTPVNDIRLLIERLQRFQNIDVPIIAKEAGEQSADIVEDRVNGQGLATNGSPLMTPSNNPIGRYGQRHGKYRESLGFTTQIVNLQVTGELWESWTTEMQGNEARVGFNQQSSRDKSANLQEIIYETAIFVPSDDEMVTVAKSIKESVNEKLNL